MGYQGPPTHDMRNAVSVLDCRQELMVGADLLALGAALQVGTVNWVTANQAFYIPFTVMLPSTAFKLGVVNSATGAGNVDMGIYNPDGTKVVSMGSTAVVVAAAWQWLNIADTLLVPGLYYLGVCFDTSGATNKPPVWYNMLAYALALMGVRNEAAAFPLPSPATFVQPTAVSIPWVAVAFRAVP